MELLSRDPALRAALFRLVDVAPACADRRDLAAHLASLLGEVEGSVAPVGFTRRVAMRRTSGPAVGAIAGLAVHRMATRFIVGADPADAVPALQRLWEHGAATSVDLLGEATITAAEADRYAQRCDDALRTLAHAARRWPARPTLDVAPRVNLSVKVTALTAQVKAEAPEFGIADAKARLRTLLRTAKQVGAHLHVDMESMDSRDLITELVIELLERARVPRRPVGGHRAPGVSHRRRRAARPAPGRHPASRSRSGSSRARTGSTRRSRRARTGGERPSTRPRWRATARSSASRAASSTLGRR